MCGEVRREARRREKKEKGRKASATLPDATIVELAVKTRKITKLMMQFRQREGKKHEMVGDKR
jgi:hypothetical protein